MPKVSVLMPTYGQAAFIRRAIDSLCGQTMADWELIVVDDGSPDNSMALVAPLLGDTRIRYHRLEGNRGLGVALNVGLGLARGRYIAYLPSDDVYYASHLATLAGLLDARPNAALAFAGVRHHYNRTAAGQIDGYPLQLVQVMHRATAATWMERAELVTDDLGRMFWAKLGDAAGFAGTGQVTCEWVDHPGQLHKLLREPLGGINPYRARFRVQKPLRFHSTAGNLIDEVEQYRRFRERPDMPAAPDGLKILLVGELAYNAERVLALEERGHRLYGLWTRDPYWYNTVGPLPFGHVCDLPAGDWRDAVRALQPDVIYALLNWQAVPFAHEVLAANLGVPFVWHFKEGPFICLEKGTWEQLIDLYARSDGQVYCSPEMRDWFGTVAPDMTRGKPSLVLDGDLPKADWFDGERPPLLSSQDGELHTVVPGRPIGLHPQTVAELAAQRIHLHFYGNFTHGQWRQWIESAQSLAPGFLHLHDNIDQGRWLAEFGRYDAGWLHFFQSKNGGELHRANWDDLNYPARIATLAAAGLPMLQRDNRGAIVATQRLAQELGLGLFFSDMAGLRSQLGDAAGMQRIRANVWRARPQFTFDYHADRLLAFFREVMEQR